MHIIYSVLFLRFQDICLGCCTVAAQPLKAISQTEHQSNVEKSDHTETLGRLLAVAKALVMRHFFFPILARINENHSKVIAVCSNSAPFGPD